MKRYAQVFSLFALMLLPSVVHACPMCFAGGEENKDAFLIGSIFLMVVPVLSLGGLGYWAYRRIKAIDGGLIRPASPGEPDAQEGAAKGVVLHMAPRQ